MRVPLRSTLKMFRSGDGVLRHTLVDSKTGLMLELETLFITRAHPGKSSKTHESMLRQLAHFNEWCFIQLNGEEDWLYPEARLLKRELPLSSGEIDDYANYCDYDSTYLATQYKLIAEKKNRNVFQRLYIKIQRRDV